MISAQPPIVSIPVKPAPTIKLMRTEIEKGSEAVITANLALGALAAEMRETIHSTDGRSNSEIEAEIHRDGLVWKDFIEQGFIIAGSPKTVRERLREAMKTLNCGHLMILMQIGSMPPDLVRASTELFAKEVMPYMRDLWSEWDDNWWPHDTLPLSQQAQPAPLSPPVPV